MRSSSPSRRRSKIRRLQVTVGGRWYLALTIGLGVVALVSGNNILYLIESLLLGGLILSGVLSERFISAVHLEIRRGPSSAGAPARDFVVISNQRRFPLFCVEVGEWKDRKFVPLAFVPKLDGNASVTVSAARVFESRGVHAWDGMAVATSYPFGFARKIKVIDRPGERLVWPRKLSERELRAEGLSRLQGIRSGQDIADGEIRPFTSDDDARMIIWILSDKGMGPMVRPRRSDESNPEVVLDLRQEPGERFEKEVVAAARPFYLQPEAASDGTLIVQDWQGRKRVTGRTPALNLLAQARAAGERR